MVSAAVTSLGPFFYGVVIDGFLYGIVATQSLLYFEGYAKERAWIKGLVASLLFLETLNTSFDIAAAYIPLLIHFGEASALTSTTWAFRMDPLTSGLIATMVQCFFAWRIKTLTSQFWISAVIAVLSLVQLAGAIGTFVSTTKLPILDPKNSQAIIIVWLAASAVADSIITGTLLLSWKRKRGGNAPEAALSRITQLTLETGLLTSIWAFATLILFLLAPTTVYFTFSFALSKLYTISLLALLVSGLMLHHDPNHEESVSRSDGKTRKVQRPRVNFIASEHNRPTNGKIFINVEAHQLSEVDDVKSSRYLEAPSAPGTPTRLSHHDH